MNTELLGLIMDFIVLGALAGTIFFALRLSKSLNNFRKYKEDMKHLMTELNKNINDAQYAIDSLRKTGDSAASDLEDLLHDSQKMTEELKMINQTSDSLANRLENASSPNPKSKPKLKPNLKPAQPLKKNSIENDETEDEIPEPPSFFIRDNEFESDLDTENNEMSANENDEFLSEAEKELMQALGHSKANG